MARCGGMQHDQGEIATRTCTMQPRRSASQGKTAAQDSLPRRIGSHFPLGLCGSLTFFILFSFLLLSLFFVVFLTYHTTEKGGATERRLRDGCAREECGRVVDG
jgi:hypothetical protein